MAMKEDRAREGKKAQYRKMGLGPMMKSGEIDFGDKHPLLKAKKEKQKNYQNPKKDERFNAAFRARMKKAGLKDSEIGDTRLKTGGLSGGQKKIAAKAPPTNKIDGKDFAVLRAEKAKDRGMGLQDEKVKPGKVMKAKRGKAIEKLAKKKGLPVPYSAMSKSSAGTTAKSAMGKTFAGYSKVFKTGVSAGDKAKATSTIIGVKPRLPKPSKESSIARRALRGVQATSLGKKLLPVVAAGVAAQQYLKSKMKKKKEEPKKKMGGGMMKVPGYAIGSPRSPEQRRRSRGPQEAKASVRERTSGRGAGVGALGGASSGKTLKQKLMSARIEGFLESTKDKVNPLKGDRVAGRGEKRVSFKPGEGASLSTRGTTGTNWRAGKDRIDEFVMSGDAEKNYKKTGKLFTNYSGKMMGGGMMNKPMGYKSGKSIKVKCKLGKNKPTKMY